MNAKTIRVVDATNTQLDWLVAQCEGHGDRWLSRWREGGDKRFTYCEVVYSYTERHEQMWPIIERAESYTLKKWAEARPDLAYQCHIWDGVVDYQGFGPTSLIAAARCYVTSKLGETVEIPDDLI